jgi:hypothetical protein
LVLAEGADPHCPEDYLAVSLPDFPWVIRVRIEGADDGAPYLTGLWIERRDLQGPFAEERASPAGARGYVWKIRDELTEPIPNSAITTDRLRKLPLGTLRLVAAEHRLGGAAAAASLLDAEVERPKAGHAWPDEHYDEVADLCLRQRALGLPELRAIQDRWNVSKPMASRYRQEAIRRGKLSETKRGKR